MRKIPKKYFIIFFLIIILVAGGYYVYQNYDSLFGTGNNSQNGGTNQFGTLETTVEKKTFDTEIELTGTTKIRNEQKLKFNTVGRITEVRFNVGDSVKKGDTIVSVDSSKAQSDIDKAVIDLDKAKRALAKTVDDLKDSKLKDAMLEGKTLQTNIDQKQKDLVFLKQKQVNELKTKEIELETARNNYIIEEAKLKKDLAISKFDQKNSGTSLADKNNTYEKQKRDYEEFKNNFQSKLDKKINEYETKLSNTYYDLEKDVRDFERVLTDMDQLVSGKFSTNEKYFSLKNTSNISKIKEHYNKANEEFKKFKDAFKNVSSKDDAKNIIKTLEEAKEFYEHIYQALVYTERGFADSFQPEDSKLFNISEESAKFNGFQARAGTMRTSITTTIDELKNFDSAEKIKKDLENELEKARLALETAESEINKFANEKDFTSNTTNATQKNMVLALNNLKLGLEQKAVELEKFKKGQDDEYKQAELAIEKDKLALKKNQEEIEKLKNIGKNDEYLSAEEVVKQAELNLENARKGLENFIIQAPFDGVITKMDYKVGDRITENSEQSISIVDPKTIEVLVNINQTDIIKVKKDMPAKVTLETYPDKVLDGKVAEIDTTPSTDEKSGLSKFSAKVLLGDYGNLNLFTGMQATVKIKTESAPEGLYVPFSSVNSEDDGRKYVTAIENGKKVKKYIEVGANYNGYYQVLSGLKEGDKILELDYDASKIKEEDLNGGNGGMFQGGM
ncbi:hypothetical protein BKN14_02685 [Candidatus Gracilibacteria bacterium HOT-871]|nr:hypothetical protein BKN14_02685 [Candidatus Gracilibacteria bacterium HOT-871]MBB1564872.1 efflux RND transporter periplasmic adaptor subunit [Candidatus Gracilibacteria bacterium]RKW21371.1 MAG: efflux RND transporter periplasmic adaptor subunit [Candidatus Gracilibacteria bacterium]